MPSNDSANPSPVTPADKSGAGLDGGAAAACGVNRLLAVAREAAEAAGAIQMAHFARHDYRVTAALAHDLKIEVDGLCETEMIGILRRRFPAHAILSEEDGAEGSPDGEYLWIIDPLDGTVNFHQGIPYFCSCVACYRLADPRTDSCRPVTVERLERAFPLAGVVYAPALGQMVCAAAGQGATWNGRPLRTPSASRLADAVIAVSLGSRQHTIRAMTRLIEALAQRVRKVRMFGATGLDLVQVACGTASGLIQPRARIWDFAAARVILGESGGALHASADRDGAWQIVAAAPPLDASLCSMLETHQV